MAFLPTTAGTALRGSGSISSALLRSAVGSLNGLLGVAAGKLVSQIDTATVSMTDIKTGQKLTLSWTPEKITLKTSGRFQSYNIIETGEVKIPRGENLQEVSWQAVLPGSGRNGDAFVKSIYWKQPKEAASILDQWRKNGSKLKLIITQAGINLDVFIQELEFTHSGGQGDINYNISFIAAKDMLVRTVDEINGKAGDLQNELEERSSMPKAEAVTVAEGDSLWDIAEAELGDGSRWEDIYNLNQGTISDPEEITPGQELKLP